jgi:N-acylneuraminate cytidylyltransferase
MSQFANPDTCPENLLKEVFAKFSNNQSSSLFTVSRNEHKLGNIVEDRFIPMNYKGSGSQDLEPPYFENGYCIFVKQNK